MFTPIASARNSPGFDSPHPEFVQRDLFSVLSPLPIFFPLSLSLTLLKFIAWISCVTAHYFGWETLVMSPCFMCACVNRQYFFVRSDRPVLCAYTHKYLSESKLLPPLYHFSTISPYTQPDTPIGCGAWRTVARHGRVVISQQTGVWLPAPKICQHPIHFPFFPM
jgi:hypothetical protein